MHRRLTLLIAGAAGLVAMFAGVSAGAASFAEKAPCVRHASLHAS